MLTPESGVHFGFDLFEPCLVELHASAIAYGDREEDALAEVELACRANEDLDLATSPSARVGHNRTLFRIADGTARSSYHSAFASTIHCIHYFSTSLDEFTDSEKRKHA